VLEVGCGLGAPAIWLADKGYCVYGIDLSQELISRATEAGRLWGVSASFMPMDLFHLAFNNGTFDVAYNHGVMEHFDDVQIQAGIAEMLRVAATAVVSVPTVHHSTRDFGDERLMTMRQWLSILKPFQVTEVVGWDYAHSVVHDAYRAYAAIARRICPRITDRWHAMLFARQVIFVLK